MYPGPIASRWGSTGTQVIGGGHPIAVFPDAESGAAAHFDLLRQRYANISLADALRRWSGGNNADSYLANITRQTGLAPDTMLTPSLLGGPQGVALVQAMAHHEAGRPYPMTAEQWQAAQRRAFGEQPPSAVPTQPTYAPAGSSGVMGMFAATAPPPAPAAPAPQSALPPIAWGMPTTGFKHGGNVDMRHSNGKHKVAAALDMIRRRFSGGPVKGYADGGRLWNTSSTLDRMFRDAGINDEGAHTNHVLQYGNHPFSQLAALPDSPFTQQQIATMTQRYNLPPDVNTLDALRRMQQGFARQGPRPPAMPTEPIYEMDIMGQRAPSRVGPRPPMNTAGSEYASGGGVRGYEGGGDVDGPLIPGGLPPLPEPAQTPLEREAARYAYLEAVANNPPPPSSIPTLGRESPLERASATPPNPIAASPDREARRQRYTELFGVDPDAPDFQQQNLINGASNLANAYLQMPIVAGPIWNGMAWAGRGLASGVRAGYQAIPPGTIPTALAGAAALTGLPAETSSQATPPSPVLQSLIEEQVMLRDQVESARQRRERERRTGQGTNYDQANDEFQRLSRRLEAVGTQIGQERERSSPEALLRARQAAVAQEGRERQQREAIEARDRIRREAPLPFDQEYPRVAAALPWVPLVGGTLTGLAMSWPAARAGRQAVRAWQGALNTAGAERGRVAGNIAADTARRYSALDYTGYSPLMGYGLPAGLGFLEGAGSINLPHAYNRIALGQENPERTALQTYARMLPEGDADRIRTETLLKNETLLPRTNPRYEEAGDWRGRLYTSLLAGIEGAGTAMAGVTGGRWRRPQPITIDQLRAQTDALPLPRRARNPRPPGSNSPPPPPGPEGSAPPTSGLGMPPSSAPSPSSAPAAGAPTSPAPTTPAASETSHHINFMRRRPDGTTAPGSPQYPPDDPRYVPPKPKRTRRARNQDLHEGNDIAEQSLTRPGRLGRGEKDGGRVGALDLVHKYAQGGAIARGRANYADGGHTYDPFGTRYDIEQLEPPAISPVDLLPAGRGARAFGRAVAAAVPEGPWSRAIADPMASIMRQRASDATRLRDIQGVRRAADEGGANAGFRELRERGMQGDFNAWMRQQPLGRRIDYALDSPLGWAAQIAAVPVSGAAAAYAANGLANYMLPPRNPGIPVLEGAPYANGGNVRAMQERCPPGYADGGLTPWSTEVALAPDAAGLADAAAAVPTPGRLSMLAAQGANLRPPPPRQAEPRRPGDWPMRMPREGYQTGGAPSDPSTLDWMRQALRDRALEGANRPNWGETRWAGPGNMIPLPAYNSNLGEFAANAITTAPLGIGSRTGAVMGNDAVMAHRLNNQYPMEWAIRGVARNPQGEVMYGRGADTAAGLMDSFGPASDNHSIWHATQARPFPYTDYILNPRTHLQPANQNGAMGRTVAPDPRNNRPPLSIIDGGLPPLPGRAHGGNVQHDRMAIGPVVGNTPGRADDLPVSVEDGSYVVPADVVSGLGEGNTLAGHAALEKVFGRAQLSGGGAIPIKISDGEHVLGRAQVTQAGGGDHAQGCRVLDQFVRSRRANTIAKLKTLPGPAKG